MIFIIMDEEDVLDYLQETYAFCKALYSFSFTERIGIALGTHRFDTWADDQIKSWSKEYLLKKLDEIKAPWWNFLFNYKITKGLVCTGFIIYVLIAQCFSHKRYNSDVITI